MKMLHLQQIESAIPKLINISLPIKIAYQLNILMDDIQKHLTRLEQFRVDFLNRHGERLNDKQISIKKDMMMKFDEGMNELLQEEIDVHPIKIPLSLLMDTDIKITVLEIESLKSSGFLIDDISTPNSIDNT